MRRLVQVNGKGADQKDDPVASRIGLLRTFHDLLPSTETALRRPAALFALASTRHDTVAISKRPSGAPPAVLPHAARSRASSWSQASAVRGMVSSSVHASIEEGTCCACHSAERGHTQMKCLSSIFPGGGPLVGHPSGHDNKSFSTYDPAATMYHDSFDMG